MRARALSQVEQTGKQQNYNSISLPRSYQQPKKIKSIKQIMNENYGSNGIPSTQSSMPQSKSSQSSLNAQKNNYFTADQNNLNLIKSKNAQDGYNIDSNFSFVANLGLFNQANSQFSGNNRDEQQQLKNRSFSSFSQNDISAKQWPLQESYSNLNTIEDYQRLIPDNISIAYNFSKQNQAKLANQSQTYRVEDILEGDKENAFINSNIQNYQIPTGMNEFKSNQSSKQKGINVNHLHSTSTQSNVSNNTNRNNISSNSNNQILSKTVAQMSNLINYNDNNSNQESNNYSDSLGYPIKKNHLLVQAQKQKEQQSYLKKSNSKNCSQQKKSSSNNKRSTENIPTYQNNFSYSQNNKQEKRSQHQSSQNGLQSTERVSQRYLNQSQQGDSYSLQKISKYLNRSLTELNSNRADQVSKRNTLHQSLNQNQIEEYIKNDQSNKDHQKQLQLSASLDVSKDNVFDKKQLTQYQTSSQINLQEVSPLDIINKSLNNSSQDKEILLKMREIIHQLQIRDASQRLEISKLRKQNNELKDQLSEKDQKIQLDEYQMKKDAEYIRQLDSQINNFQQKLNGLQKQLSEEQNKWQSNLEERNQVVAKLEVENMQLRSNVQQLIENQQEQIDKIEMHQYLDQYDQYESNNNIEQQNDFTNDSRLNINSNSSREEKAYVQMMNHSDEESDLMKSYLSDATSIKQKDKTLMLQTQNINFLNTNGNTLETTNNYFPNEEDIIREQAEEEEQSERSQYDQGQKAPQQSQSESRQCSNRSSKNKQLQNQNFGLNLAKSVNVNLQSLIQMSKQNSSLQSNSSVQTIQNSQKPYSKINSTNNSNVNTMPHSLNTSMSIREQINKKIPNGNASIQQQNSRLLSIQSPNGQLMQLDSSILYNQNQYQTEKYATAAGLTPSQICSDSNKVMTSTTQMNMSFSSPSSSSSINPNEFRKIPFIKKNSSSNESDIQGILTENQNYINQNSVNKEKKQNIISFSQQQGNASNVLKPLSQNLQQFQQQNKIENEQQSFNFKQYFSQLNMNNQNAPNNNFDPNQLLRKQNVFVHSSQLQNNVFQTANEKENDVQYSNQSLQQIVNQKGNFINKKASKIQQYQHQVLENNLDNSKISISSKNSSEYEQQRINEQLFNNFHSSQSNNKDCLDIDPYQFITEEMTNNISSDYRYNELSNPTKREESQDLSLSNKNMTENDDLSQQFSKNSNDLGEIKGELTEEQTQEILKILKQKLEREYTFDEYNSISILNYF